MQGMFRANGGCGYVKKPNFLLRRGPNDELFDPNLPWEVKTIMTVDRYIPTYNCIFGFFICHSSIVELLTVKVYLGEGWHQDFHHTAFDRYSPPDFYTRIGVAGVPADKDVKQTATIEDEWLPGERKEI
ncbi:Phosphoinositide phospholipase C 6 [Gossypium australe]|uniref:Phosphoinositide phospholipase C 6 n=1 Tax=Gossypium australe TaxID=47621 RepID=A0A5B6X8W5_9ROSI|nr:Phosphoinositide phospholipase C 6 [Gossypium australe]